MKIMLTNPYEDEFVKLYKKENKGVARMTEITVNVDTSELQKQLDDLDLNNVTPEELESFIKEHIEVTLVKEEKVSNGELE